MPGKQSKLKSFPLTEMEKVDVQGMCQRCGLWNRTASVCTKQFSSWGSETPIVFVVMPRIVDEDSMAGGVCGDEQVRNFIMAQIAQAMQIDDPVPHVRFASLVRCPSGATKPTMEHYKHCADLLALEIARYRPRIVFGVGGAAKTDVYAALGLPQRTRGFVQEVPRQIPLSAPLVGEKKRFVASLDRGEFPCHVLKTSNIAWAFREPFVFKEIMHDFTKIRGILDGTYPAADTFAGRNYHVVKDADFAIQVLQYFAGLDRFAFDIEAGPAPYALDPYTSKSKVLGVGFADVHRNSYFIPLHHKDCPYKDRLADVLQALQGTLQSPAEKTAHNVAYDGTYLRIKYGYEVTNIHFDTQLAHGLIDENLFHSLKYLSEMDTDLGYYDDELLDGFRDEKGKKVTAGNRCYENHVSLDVLGRYCCADADATEQLRVKYEEELRSINMLDYFYKMTMPDVRSVIETQVAGVAINTPHRDSMLIDFQTKLDAAKIPIVNTTAHKVWMVDKSKDLKGKGKYLQSDEGFIYRDFEHCMHHADKPVAWFSEDGQTGREYAPGGFDELRMAKVMLKTRDSLAKNSTYRVSELELNPHSNPDLQKFLYGKRYCGLNPVKATPSGGASTDKESMNKLKEQDPVCQAIIDVRTWQKNLSTYCLPFQQGQYEYVDTKGKKKTGIGYIRDDGLCHPSFIMTGNDRGQGNKEKGKGTRTGRKSAVEPPIQTMKTRGAGSKPIKKLFVTKHIDPTGALMQWDFSQLELRLFGIVAGISWMIERYQEGADLHLELAMEVWNKTSEECLANNGEYRGHTKSIWFGPLYGESPKGIAEDLTKKGLIISEDETKDILDKMYARMPEYKVFEQKTVQSLRDTCCVWTVTGRRRYLPTFFSSEKYIVSQAKRQAINFQIQSPGSDMMTLTWFTLNNWAKRLGLKSRVVISVHDSIIWDCPPGEMPIVAVATKYVMEHVPFQFLVGTPVPILADGEAGTSWGSMIDLSKAHDTTTLKEKKGIEDLSVIGSDLLPYVNTGVVPYEHWYQSLSEHSYLDPLKEFCSTPYI